ncbi:MAG: type II secretion system protein [Gammaproteobacteria bacterium]|nr:type II secretion system protein [Gammaproteobacteria bacterium]
MKSLRANRGFTLLELAIVVFVVGLLLAGMIGPIDTQIEARDRRLTTSAMNEALEAVYGFAVSAGRLPCPDTTGDGVEDFASGPPPWACAAADGWLPSTTLATAGADAWGNRLRYHVTEPGFTTPDDGICSAADADLDLCESGGITVQTRGDNPATAAPVTEGKFLLTSANDVPAVIVSHGRNGRGSTSNLGIARAAAPINTDEDENADGDNTFITRIYTRDAGGCSDDADENTALCGYDDLLLLVSPTVLNNRLVMAGRLP